MNPPVPAPPRASLRWLLVVLVPVMGAVLWSLLPPRTDDPYFGFNWGGPNVRIHGAKLQHGDDRRWASPDFDDSQWPETKLSQLPRHRGVFWVRVVVEVPPPGPRGIEVFVPSQTSRFPTRWRVVGPSEAVFTLSNCARELFWDGVKCGQSGVPANSRELEQPGPNDALYVLPADLRSPGRHVMAIRISSYHTEFPSPWFIFMNYFGPYEELARRPYVPAMFALATLAAAAIVGAIFLFAWGVVERRRSYLAFSVFCFLVAVSAGLIVPRTLAGTLYSDFYRLLLASGVINLLTGAAMLAFFALHLRLPRPGWIVGLFMLPAVALIPAFHHLYFIRGHWHTRWFLVSALALCIVGRARRQPGSLRLGLLVGAVYAGFWVLEPSLPGNMGDPLIAGLIGGIAALLFRDLGLQVRAEQLKARQSQLASARLEIELLKKNIQPHFLLNSLASVVELVEQQPADAAKLIHALADEFRILARVSAQRLIPLSQEIELCESHLRVMSLRRETTYRLRTELLEPAAAVPPALIHTLVENAITHGGPAAGERVFRLVQTRGTDGRERYEFFSPLAESPAPRPSEGTGTRYVHARLEESFPGRWRHEAGVARGEWRVLIEILPAAAVAPAEASA